MGLLRFRHTRLTKDEEVHMMTKSKAGCQTIGCRVASCAYNKSGHSCDLDCVEIAPRRGCHSGEACDESICASYKAR